MTERDFEDILAKYPDLIEEGLILEGRQVGIGRKHVDLVFRDKHRARLIAELKRGSILREHIGQVLDYEGELLTPDEPTDRVMLIGNRVPPNFRRTLEHHGIEWKELPVQSLIAFLRDKDDHQFDAVFAEENISMQCRTASGSFPEKLVVTTTYNSAANDFMTPQTVTKKLKGDKFLARQNENEPDGGPLFVNLGGPNSELNQDDFGGMVLIYPQSGTIYGVGPADAITLRETVMDKIGPREWARRQGVEGRPEDKSSVTVRVVRGVEGSRVICRDRDRKIEFPAFRGTLEFPDGRCDPSHVKNFVDKFKEFCQRR